jgi:DNA-binding response OmpR family regulator
MYNLLSNAIKFTPEGGRVTVNARVEQQNSGPFPLPFEMACHGGWMVIRVADTGVGIKREDQTRIFVEFVQVDSSYGRKQQGTGLGLTLTRKLVEAHSGKISVQSDGEGKGSVFTVVLPIAATPSNNDTAFFEGDVAAPLVMVVSMPSSAETSVTQYLSDSGYAVAVSHNAEEIRQVLDNARPFAVVLPDAVLPGGVEALRHIIHGRRGNVPLVRVRRDGDGRLLFSDVANSKREYESLNQAVRKFARPANTELKTVLLVDDEPSVSQLLSNLLIEHGFRIVRAQTGRRAVRLAGVCLPDAVVLDLHMPEVDGFQVLESLRANSRTSHVPVFVHTGVAVTAEDKAKLASVRAITTKLNPAGLICELQQLNNEGGSRPA